MDALVATAPADVAKHGVVDLLIGRRRCFRQQRSRLHDLTGLAITALRHADISRGHLYRVLALGVQPSMVTTFFPATSDMAMLQERTASP